MNCYVKAAPLQLRCVVRLNGDMADFKLLSEKTSNLNVISAPRRSRRPNESKGTTADVCPFCPGREAEEPDVYRVGGQSGDSNWQIRVINNKFPFAPVHEVIVYSPDHHKGLDELPLGHAQLVLETYQQRFNTYREKGNVYIFHNKGIQGGESQPHPHTQLTVTPYDFDLAIPPLNRTYAYGSRLPFLGGKLKILGQVDGQVIAPYETRHFVLFCPPTSQWPDEVWVAPKRRGGYFGDITADEMADFTLAVSRLIQVMDIRHGHDFPHNFYIYPGENWYFRLIPRSKILGGFEVGTNVFVNTQDPHRTMAFIREHFENPDIEKIQAEHMADYHRAV